MSFWRTFGFHSISAIDTLLESDYFTLEQLLDEEEIIQETKAQNKKLIEFLTEEESIKKLVSYITKEPEEENDSKRRFKYPFLACEILGSEIWAICNSLLENHQLDELFGYLTHESPLNPMLGSYTCRVLGVLLQKNIGETISHMKEKKDVIPSFIKHLGNASVMDLLLKLISCEDTPEGAGVLDWLCKTNLVASLIDKFDPKLSSDIHENAAQALADIVAISFTSASSPLIAQLESDSMVKTLFGYILSEDFSSSLFNGLTVVIELLKRHVSEQHDDVTTVENLPPILNLVVNNLTKFHGYLLNPMSDKNNDAKLILPSGNAEPLGFHRLKVVEFFSILIRTNYKCIDEAIAKNNIMKTCLDLFFTYMWNNFLHIIVEQTIQGVLDGENSELKKSLLVDCRLLNRIVEAHKENESECSKPKGVRRGYMGHLTTISQFLVQSASVDPTVEKIMSENHDWIDYVQGPLAQTREKESRPADYPDFTGEPDDDFVGENYPVDDRDPSIDDDDDDDDDEDDDDDDDRVVQARLEEEDDDEVVEASVSSSEVWTEKEILDVVSTNKETAKEEDVSAVNDEEKKLSSDQN